MNEADKPIEVSADKADGREIGLSSVASDASDSFRKVAETNTRELEKLWPSTRTTCD